MKLQLDTSAKTVKIESDVKMSVLIKALKSLLPNDWKDFTLQTNTTINNWSYPIYIEKHTYPYYPWYFNGTVMCDGWKDTPQSSGLTSGSGVGDYKNAIGNHSCELKSGIYNVEL